MTAEERQMARLVEDAQEGRVDRAGFLRRATALGMSASVASAIFAASAGASSSSSAGASASSASTDKLTIRTTADMDTLDPAFYTTDTDGMIGSAIMEGLITYKPGTLERTNVLAKTFTPSKNGLRFDFTLKQGIQFHGGYGELTADDVKYSYERIAGLTKPKINSPYSGDWSPALKEVKVKNKYEGTIILKQPFAAVMRSTLPVGSGWVLSKKAIIQKGKNFGTHPIGTGPYEFTKWTPKQSIVLTQFAQYGKQFDYGGTPFKELHFIPIADDSASDIALQSGAIDFAGHLSLQGIDKFAADSRFKVYKQTTLNYNWIGMNMRNPKLTDIRVRKAIRLAVDVPGILQAAFLGKEQRATAIIPPNMGVGYWKEAPVYNRDVKASKALLQEAGVNGLELSFMYTHQTGAADLAQIVQQNLADVGIKVTLNQVDSATMNTLGKNLRQRELFYTGYVTEPDPSWSTVWFVCKQLDVWNWMYWCDAKYDKLHYAALKTLDEEKRSQMYIEMQKLWDAAAHTIWTHWPTLYFGSKSNVHASIYPTGYWLPQAFKVT